MARDYYGILGVDKDGTEWYQITLGGSDGSNHAPAAVAGKVIGPSFAADEVQDAIEAVIETYQAQRTSGEKFIDTVKRVENPSGLVQSADRLFVFTDGDARYADVDLGAPIDLGADAEDAYTATPSGTSEVASSGSYIAYLTDAGAVYAASINAQSAEGRSPSIRIDPYADDSRPVDERPTFAASTVTIGNDGTVYAYSPTEGRVIRADAATGRIEGEDAVTDGPTDAAQLSVVDDTWALFEASSGNVWIRGKQQPVSSGATAGLLQRPGGTGSVIYVADAAGLVAVSLDGSGSQRVVDDASGTPAAPMPSRTGVYAAWLPATGEGRLWSSTAGETTLDYAGKDLGDEIAPEFQSNGTRMILNDTRSGWMTRMQEMWAVSLN
mgnify:CR=1 FL=1